MFGRQTPRNSLFGSPSQLWKPKNPHSLEYLKYLYGVLCKNQTVTEQNSSLLVEALRSMSEILIWGDQNDDTVFDFFLEKSLLSFFLSYMKQKSGGYICVQLLQTLNILFENISKEASIYYLLSNNHVNSIISHRFDFSDEEVMAYYISFLKTLSLKLNRHTIHFFYNEHAREFPLYTEAVNFFNHSESMVRIAVRTITLNVFRVDDKALITFVCDTTAVGYFPELAACIGKRSFELDSCVRNDAEHSNRGRLADLLCEHVDYLHYISDIFRLGVEPLSDLLTDLLLQSLFNPIHVRSLLASAQEQYQLRLHQLRRRQQQRRVELAAANASSGGGVGGGSAGAAADASATATKTAAASATASPPISSNLALYLLTHLLRRQRRLCQRRQLDVLLEFLKPPPSAVATDSAALFCLSFVLAVRRNTGLAKPSALHSPCCARLLCSRLMRLLAYACCEPRATPHIRPVTAELAAQLLSDLVVRDCRTLTDGQWAMLEGAREDSALSLRECFRNEDLFLDQFEDEWRCLELAPVNVEQLMMESSLLLAPAGTPLTGIEFDRRLPCGEAERVRRSIRMFLLLRRLCYGLRREQDPDLPLLSVSTIEGSNNAPIRLGDSLDLNNSDLIGCRVERSGSAGAAGVKPPAERRFLAVDASRHQAVLVEPDAKRLGWGVARFIGELQYAEAVADREDSRSLHVAFHNPGGPTVPRGAVPRPPLLTAKFVFDDHIRCMAAKQRLIKGRQLVRTEKMAAIGRLLEFPDSVIDAISPGHSARKAVQRQRASASMSPSRLLSTSSSASTSNIRLPTAESVVGAADGPAAVVVQQPATLSSSNKYSSSPSGLDLGEGGELDSSQSQ
uniref:FPL domain-containing protein n=1 Tax=Macrostomum lignano TaxID=282301 RepID=A0A1I8HEU6_9PLAT